MRTNRKTEEKKMSMSKNIARLAVTAGLTAALSFGGVMAPVTMAFAEGSTVTFEDSTYSSSTTYKGIQIFTATVTKAAEGTTVSNIAWASSDAHLAVVSAIEEMDKSYHSENAQDAADWLNNNNKEANATDANTKVSVDHVLNKIAVNLKDSTKWRVADKDSSLGELGAGYWLFLTNEVDKTAAGNSTDTFSSPVYAVIDGTSKVKITPKKSVPTVEKKILDDNKVKDNITTVPATDWSDVADSQIGQVVNYKLTGSVASNYATYGSYAYKFTDELSSGLDYVEGSVVVYALNNDVYTEIDSNSYNVTKPSGSSRDLVVNFNKDEKGLKSAAAKNGEELTINGETKIVVFYKAKLNASASIAGANNQLKVNPNTVTLEYSNNPMSNGTGTSASDTVEDYTYGLKINKVDLGTESALNGAKFTIKVESADDKDSAGQYVQGDGKLGIEPWRFATTDDGTFTVKGLDAGTYTVEEVEAPQGGYTTVKKFEFTITSKLTTDPGAKYELDPKGQQNQIIIGTPNDVKDDNKLVAAGGTTTNGDGTLNITVGDTKQVGLPLTGLNGVTFTWIAGGAVLCIGVAHLIRSRKQAEESEQE